MILAEVEGGCGDDCTYLLEGLGCQAKWWWGVPYGIKNHTFDIEVAQSCPICCDPVDYSMLGFSVCGWWFFFF